MTGSNFLVTFANKIVEKVWGVEFWIENTDKYCLKVLRLKPGYRCSLHYHPKKTETFLVLDGMVRVEIGTLGDSSFLKSGEKVLIPPGKPHRFGSHEGAHILEISTTHSDLDVVRLEESAPIPHSERLLYVR